MSSTYSDDFGDEFSFDEASLAQIDVLCERVFSPGRSGSPPATAATLPVSPPRPFFRLPNDEQPLAGPSGLNLVAANGHSPFMDRRSSSTQSVSDVRRSSPLVVTVDAPPAVGASSSPPPLAPRSHLRHLEIALEMEHRADQSLEAEEGDSDLLSSIGEDEKEHGMDVDGDASGSDRDKSWMSESVIEEPIHASLFAEFKRGVGRFSITDLTAPVWCEVQYDYGLRSQRYLPPEHRPETFISRMGRVIEPDRAAASSNDMTLKQGTKVHDVLEKETHPVKIHVKAETKEEIWALRILDMLASLESLMVGGTCREMRVMGFIQGFFVTGIIDEIRRQAIPGPEASSASPSKGPKASSKKKAAPPAQSNKITSYFETPSTSVRPSPATPTHTLHISDTKTRQVKSLPPESASLAGKLQVQAYKLLLDTLLLPRSAPESFPFHMLYEHIGLNPCVSLSADFRAQAWVLIEGNALQIADFWSEDDELTLEMLVDAWDESVARLGIDRHAGVNETLELVYRLRERGDLRLARSSPKKGTGKRKGKRKFSLAAEHEDGSASASTMPWQGSESSERELLEGTTAELQRTILASLGIAEGGDGGLDGEQDVEDAELARAIAVSLQPASTTSDTIDLEGVQPRDLSPPMMPPRLALPAPNDPLLQEDEPLLPPVSDPLVISSAPPSPSAPVLFPLAVASPPLANSQAAIHFSTPATNANLSSSPTSFFPAKNEPAFPSSPVVVPPPPTPASPLPPPPPFTKESLLELKLPELKRMCYDCQLPAWGRKIDIASRLIKLLQPPLPPAIALSSSLSAAAAASALTQQQRQSSSATTTSANPLPAASSSAVHPIAFTPLKPGDIIGIRQVNYDHTALLAHLEDILDFWLGQRAPRGVSMMETAKCDWCEFKDGCEWRESQALKLTEEMRARKLQGRAASSLREL